MISPAASGWKFRGARVFVASTRGEGRRFGTPVFAARRKDEEEKDLEEKKRRGTEDAKRKTRATKPRRRAKNAPTKRAPELSKEEKTVFTALNERILRCTSAEAIGDVLAEKDAVLSDVNIATIFSLLGKKCNAKKTKDSDALGWNALAVERLITSGAFQEKVLSPCEG